MDWCTGAGRTGAHVAVRTSVQEQGGMVIMSLCGQVHRSREDWCTGAGRNGDHVAVKTGVQEQGGPVLM